MKTVRMTRGEFTFAVIHDPGVNAEQQEWFITLCSPNDEALPAPNAAVHDSQSDCTLSQTYARLHLSDDGWHWRLPAGGYNLPTVNSKYSTEPIPDPEAALDNCLAALKQDLERQRRHGEAGQAMRRLLDGHQPETIPTPQGFDF